MSEFPAHQARELMLQKDKWNSEKWYTNFKDKFFKEIKNESLKGNNSILLESDQWDCSNHNKVLLNSNLTKLGYKVTSSSRNHEETLIISW